MYKLRSWDEIVEIFYNGLVASFPDQKFTTNSNMYKVMYPIMEEVQRIEERQMAYLDRNNYLKAEGVDLDVYFYDRNFPRRKQSKSKGVWTTINSISGVSVLAGTMKFSDNKNNTFVNLNDFIVDSTGKAVVEIECEQYGKSGNVEANTINTIKTPVSGVVSGTNLDALQGGEDLESDVDYRFRWETTKNSKSFWNTDGIYNAINEVAGVKSCRVIENDSDLPITVGGLEMPSRSRRYYVDGGSNLDIAKAIFYKTDRAIKETGTEEVKVKDIQGDDRTVKFSRPNYVKIYTSIKIDGFIDTTETQKIINKYITDSKISQKLTSFAVVEIIRHSVDATGVINLEISFSRDNVNFETSLELEVFEKAVI